MLKRFKNAWWRFGTLFTVLFALVAISGCASLMEFLQSEELQDIISEVTEKTSEVADEFMQDTSETIKVTGKVKGQKIEYDSESGRNVTQNISLQNARIIIVVYGKTFSATTSSSGQYQVTVDAPEDNNMLILVKKTGYTPYVGTILETDHRNKDYSNADLTLSEFDATAAATFKDSFSQYSTHLSGLDALENEFANFDLFAAFEGSINGQITIGGGFPLGGADIVIKTATTAETSFNKDYIIGFSDPLGYYFIDGLPSGTYILEARHHKITPATSSEIAVTDTAPNQTYDFSVAQDNYTGEVNINFDDFGGIKGRVLVLEEGNMRMPIPGEVNPTILLYDDQGNPMMDAWIDFMGQFELRGIEMNKTFPAKVRISFAKDMFQGAPDADIQQIFGGADFVELFADISGGLTAKPFGNLTDYTDIELAKDAFDFPPKLLEYIESDNQGPGGPGGPGFGGGSRIDKKIRVFYNDRDFDAVGAVVTLAKETSVSALRRAFFQAATAAEAITATANSYGDVSFSIPMQQDQETWLVTITHAYGVTRSETVVFNMGDPYGSFDQAFGWDIRLKALPDFPEWEEIPTKTIYGRVRIEENWNSILDDVMITFKAKNAPYKVVAEPYTGSSEYSYQVVLPCIGGYDLKVEDQIGYKVRADRMNDFWLDPPGPHNNMMNDEPPDVEVREAAVTIYSPQNQMWPYDQPLEIEVMFAGQSYKNSTLEGLNVEFRRKLADGTSTLDIKAHPAGLPCKALDLGSGQGYQVARVNVAGAPVNNDGESILDSAVTDYQPAGINLSEVAGNWFMKVYKHGTITTKNFDFEVKRDFTNNTFYATLRDDSGGPGSNTKSVKALEFPGMYATLQVSFQTDQANEEFVKSAPIRAVFVQNGTEVVVTGKTDASGNLYLPNFPVLDGGLDVDIFFDGTTKGRADRVWLDHMAFNSADQYAKDAYPGTLSDSAYTHGNEDTAMSNWQPWTHFDGVALNSRGVRFNFNGEGFTLTTGNIQAVFTKGDQTVTGNMNDEGRINNVFLSEEGDWSVAISGTIIEDQTITLTGLRNDNHWDKWQDWEDIVVTLTDEADLNSFLSFVTINVKVQTWADTGSQALEDATVVAVPGNMPNTSLSYTGVHVGDEWYEISIPAAGCYNITSSKTGYESWTQDNYWTHDTSWVPDFWLNSTGGAERYRIGFLDITNVVIDGSSSLAVELQVQLGDEIKDDGAIEVWLRDGDGNKLDDMQYINADSIWVPSTAVYEPISGKYLVYQSTLGEVDTLAVEIREGDAIAFPDSTNEYEVEMARRDVPYEIGGVATDTISHGVDENDLVSTVIYWDNSERYTQLDMTKWKLILTDGVNIVYSRTIRTNDPEAMDNDLVEVKILPSAFDDTTYNLVSGTAYTVIIGIADNFDDPTQINYVTYDEQPTFTKFAGID